MEGSRGCIYLCISLLLLFSVIVLSFHSPWFLCKLLCLFAFLITCRVNFSFARENAAGRIRQGEVFWLKYFQHGISIVACDFEHCETFVCLAFFPCFSQSFSISQAADGKRESRTTLNTFCYLLLNLYFHTQQRLHMSIYLFNYMWNLSHQVVSPLKSQSPFWTGLTLQRKKGTSMESSLNHKEPNENTPSDFNPQLCFFPVYFVCQNP